MKLPLLDYTEPFNAAATLLLVALLLWVGLKEKKNTLPMVVVVCSMLILAVQIVELMLKTVLTYMVDTVFIFFVKFR